MPTAALYLPATMTTAALPGVPIAQYQQPQQQQSSPPQPPPKLQLRRATYVHVSDLLSAYNIDHSKLEEELHRVLASRCRDDSRSTTGRASSPSLGVPTELDTSASPKKLQPPRGGFNLCVLVGHVDVVVDKRRVDGSRVRLAEVEVGDETGRVSLRARDEQIDLLEQVSARAGAVVLRNCTLELFQGKHIRLAVTKWGKITPYPDQVASTPVPPSNMNEDRFFSSIDLSLVATDSGVHSQNEGYRSVAQSVDAIDPTGYMHSSTSHHPGPQPPQQHQPQTSRAGRGGVPRKPTRLKPALQPYPTAVPMATYADATSLMRFQSGLHGFGYVENMDSYGYHRQRQSDNMASAAHMMLQQQYEMHQRQIQQQMYHHPSSRPPPHEPSKQHASMAANAGVATNPVLNPGLHPAVGTGVASLDATFSTPGAGVGGAGEVFLTHGIPPGAPPASVFPTRSTTAAAAASDPRQPTTASQNFPASPKMNPRAATFDPSRTGAH